LADSSAVVPAPDPLAPYLAEAEKYVRAAKASNTVKAYRSDWRSFASFCSARELAALPATAATVAAYAAHAAVRLKANTIERHLAAMSQAHQLAGVPNPVEDKLVRTVMAGIRRARGTAQKGKEPLSAELLRKMFSGMPDDLRAARDRALLLVGFAGAFRRSEIVSVRHEDVRFTDEGVVITIPRSKTDPEGEGHTIGIPYGSHPESCPVRALEDRVRRANINCGYLFTRIGRWGGEVTEEGISDHLAGQNHQAAGSFRWARSRCLLRALAPLGARHRRGRGRRQRTLHHGPDAPPVSQAGEEVHPPRQPVQRQRGGEKWL
jgi:integrase